MEVDLPDLVIILMEPTSLLLKQVFVLVCLFFKFDSHEDLWEAWF